MAKKSFREFMRGLSYMQASLSLFVLSLLLSLVLGIRAVISAGRVGYTEGALAFLALVLSIAGFVVPVYGHFIVKNDSRTDWRLGVLLNGLLMLFLTFIYFLGI